MSLKLIFPLNELSSSTSPSVELESIGGTLHKKQKQRYSATSMERHCGSDAVVKFRVRVISQAFQNPPSIKELQAEYYCHC